MRPTAANSPSRTQKPGPRLTWCCRRLRAVSVSRRPSLWRCWSAGRIFSRSSVGTGATGPGERFADYLSVESLVASGEISQLAVNGRFPLSAPFRETGFFIPADLSRAQAEAVLEVATAALHALGVRTGGFHTEIKLTPDGPRVIEVNGRIGGGVPEMLFQASGVSIFKLSMRVALGEPVVVEGPIPCDRIGWCFLIQPPISARRFVGVEGLDRLAERPGVNRVLLNRTPGDPIDLWDGTFHYIYSVYGVATDYDEVVEINRFLHEEVKIFGQAFCRVGIDVVE